jgi:anti-sigma B factor antagonist
MKIEERQAGGVTILDVQGKLVMGDANVLLKDKVHSLVNQGLTQILIDLGNVSYVDSAGLGGLVAAYTTVSRAGGQLKLLNVTKRIQDLLAITRLLTVFETFSTEGEAVRSFAASTV